MNFNPYYFYSFDKNNVYNEFSEDKEEVDTRYREIMNYINSRSSKLDEEFFSYEDKTHLRDVRKINHFFYFFFFISSLVLTVMFLNKKLTAKTLVTSGKINSIIILSLLITTLTLFQKAFVLFHKLLFRNDYWLLDPTTSNLIKYFPDGVFREIVIIILIFDIIITILFFLPWIKNRKKF